MAAPPVVLFASLSFISARPDLAADGRRSMSRLDGMPWMSATVFRGRSRFGFLAVTFGLGAAFLGAAFRGTTFFGLPAVALAEVGAAFLATARLTGFAAFLAFL